MKTAILILILGMGLLMSCTCIYINVARDLDAGNIDINKTQDITPDTHVSVIPE